MQVGSFHCHICYSLFALNSVHLQSRTEAMFGENSESMFQRYMMHSFSENIFEQDCELNEGGCEKLQEQCSLSSV